MNRYSLILLEIDGTLLDSRNEISANSKRLLNRLQKKGIPIALVSSDAPCEAEFVAQRANLRAPIICYGGSLVLDENRSILEDIGIPRSVALSFKAFAERQFPDVSVNTYIYDIWIADESEQERAPWLAGIAQKEPLTGDLASAMRMTNHAHKFLCVGSPQRIQTLKRRVDREFPTLSCSLSSSVSLEIIAKRASKGAAMEVIRRYYGVDAAQIVAIGNHFADVELLRGAGLGIAMGDAPEAVRSAADRVTASRDDEGVYIALKGLRFQPPVRPDKASEQD